MTEIGALGNLEVGGSSPPLGIFRDDEMQAGLGRRLRLFGSRMKATAINLATYPVSSYYAAKNKELFKDIKCYCMFIGYPRSGHSLVGSLIDAHPDAIIAHERDVLGLVELGFGQRQLFSLILENSGQFARKGREWTGYPYVVPNQWQGKFRKLSVIGDKQGGKSTRRLSSKPELLERLQKTVGVETKLIHVLRNPYDNISTMCKRNAEGLEASIEKYFSLAKTNESIRKKLKEDVLDVRHEGLIANPRKELKHICAFLGLRTTEDYLEDCAGIIFKKPRKTRKNAAWTAELIEEVAERMKELPFMEGYSYDS